MNYYEHHLGDYEGATAHLSWLEDCAYRRLICLYYRNEAPIPADLKQACRLVRAASKQERGAVEQVLSEFFTLEADGWHHKRCDEEVARYRERSEKARASVSKRWANRDANAMLTDNERNTNVSPDGYERITNDIHRAPVPRHQTPDTRHQRERKDGNNHPDPEPPPPALTGVVSSFQRPLPEDWTPKPETVARVVRARPDLADRVPAIAEDFRLYLATQTGAKALSADWESSFLRWASKERENVKRNASARLPGGFVC